MLKLLRYGMIEMVFPVTVPDSAADWEAGPGFKSHHGIDLEAAAASLSLRLTQSLRP